MVEFGKIVYFSLYQSVKGDSTSWLEVALYKDELSSRLAFTAIRIFYLAAERRKPVSSRRTLNNINT